MRNKPETTGVFSFVFTNQRQPHFPLKMRFSKRKNCSVPSVDAEPLYLKSCKSALYVLFYHLPLPTYSLEVTCEAIVGVLRETFVKMVVKFHEIGREVSWTFGRSDISNKVVSKNLASPGEGGRG